MALPNYVSIHESRAGCWGQLGVEGNRVQGDRQGTEEGTALPCPAPAKLVARSHSELMDPHVIGN